VHAADQLRAARGRAARVTTVALATPFLHARARTITKWPLFIIALFGAFLLASATGVAITGSWRSLVGAVLIVGGAAFAALLALCAAGAVLHRRSLGSGWRSRLVAATHAPTARPEDTIVIRAANDEASGLLVAGQFAGWLSAVATRLLTDLMLWAVLIASVQLVVVVTAI